MDQYIHVSLKLFRKTKVHNEHSFTGRDERHPRVAEGIHRALFTRNSMQDILLVFMCNMRMTPQSLHSWLNFSFSKMRISRPCHTFAFARTHGTFKPSAEIEPRIPRQASCHWRTKADNFAVWPMTSVALLSLVKNARSRPCRSGCHQAFAWKTSFCKLATLGVAVVEWAAKAFLPSSHAHGS